ncbi:GNAT family N-acetyltransferase [Acidovorax sp.]|uniref:GNAT family N-acetyltransferase n=1 Tax=Acidovorax sp. TaxID=1872122 RepID=UPI0026059A50|nr:GNAT family N-acetyltransferase [Acidovorax sp.]
MNTLLPDLHIRLDDLSDPRIEQFMEEHLQDMRATSPPESVHALDMGQLRQPDIRFWTAWRADGQLVGTGALKHLGAEHAELKSMRTTAAARGQGVGRAILEHILGQAVDLGYQRISLETGSQPFFDPAYRLYLRYGFADCAPFGSYGPDPHSRFMTRAL